MIEKFMWPTKGSFKNLKTDYRIMVAYYIAGMTLMAFLNYLIDNYMTLEGEFLADNLFDSLASFWFSSFIFVVVFAVFSLLFNLGIMHHTAKFLGGGGTPLDTLGVVAFGATPLFVLGWFPCLGQFSYLIVLANYFVGIREVHGLSKFKSAITVLAPLVVVFFLAAIILFYIFISGNNFG
jgi:hypothetical protein